MFYKLFLKKHCKVLKDLLNDYCTSITNAFCLVIENIRNEVTSARQLTENISAEIWMLLFGLYTLRCLIAMKFVS